MKKVVLPYVESLPERISTLFELISFEKDRTFVDLGSGDGRIVIEMAKRGLKAYGFEHQQKYVRRSLFHIKNEGLEERAFIKETNFWDEDLGIFDVVFIYGMADLIPDLKIKLEKELKTGAIFISNGFPIPGWDIYREKEHIYIYVV